jgi:hypothetical protein
VTGDFHAEEPEPLDADWLEELTLFAQADQEDAPDGNRDD